MRPSYRDLISGLIVFAALTWFTQAHAGILMRGNATKPASCTAKWDWTLAAVAEKGPNLCKPNWLIVPESPAGPAGGPKSLSFKLQHLVSVPGHGYFEIAPNPAKPVTVPAGVFAAGISRAGAFVLEHPFEGHHDVYVWDVFIPAAGGAAGGFPEIFTRAKHLTTPFPAGWSYDPLGSKASIDFVEASYDNDPPKKAKDVNPNKTDKKSHGTLPDGKTGEKPTDYTVSVTQGDPFSAEMTLAYVVTLDDGTFGEADLAIMNEFFVPGGEYFVPMLFDVNETQNLFIGVNLVQWLSSPTAFSMGDLFSFTNGVSDLLPGFFVATSPVNLDPVTGMFTSGDPFDGSGIVLGRADGGNVRVPEPSTGLLFGTGLLGLLYTDWRRRQRAM